MKKIVFFNHYHKGDLHTHKEFVRQIKTELKDFDFEYLTNNPAKLIEELGIPVVGSPDELDRQNAMYKTNEAVYINTWVGCLWDVFCKHGGINMHTLHEQWSKLVTALNKVLNTNIVIREEKESYLPKIDYSLCHTKCVNDFLDKRGDRVKVLVCNNVPNSSQSFQSTMVEFIEPLAKKYPKVDFYLTNEIQCTLDNIFYTKEITCFKDKCDLLDISYLSTFCDVIVGKNSGPFVFCETYENYMDESKTFLSFNTKHPDYDDVKETMSNGLNIKCSYRAVPIKNIINLNEEDKKTISFYLNEVLTNNEKIKDRLC